MLIILLKACERILDGSLFLPAFYGFFQGLEPVKRQKTQLLAESLIGQLAAGFAGLIFLVFNPKNQFDLHLGLLFSICFATMLMITGIIAEKKYHYKMEQFLNPPLTS